MCNDKINEGHRNQNGKTSNIRNQELNKINKVK